jgi:hypothetical protein
LLLLGKAYVHSAEIVQRMYVSLSACVSFGASPYEPTSAAMNMTVALMVEIDKLIQFIESPIFTG